MEKYASFRSTFAMQSQSPGWISGCGCPSFWNDVHSRICWVLSGWWQVFADHPFWGPERGWGEEWSDSLLSPLWTEVLWLPDLLMYPEIDWILWGGVCEIGMSLRHCMRYPCTVFRAHLSFVTISQLLVKWLRRPASCSSARRWATPMRAIISQVLWTRTIECTAACTWYEVTGTIWGLSICLWLCASLGHSFCHPCSCSELRSWICSPPLWRGAFSKKGVSVSFLPFWGNSGPQCLKLVHELLALSGKVWTEQVWWSQIKWFILFGRGSKVLLSSQ